MERQRSHQSLAAVGCVRYRQSVELPTDKAAGPRILGRYAIYDAIAAGGMATVHYGRLLGPVGFSRTVAIKRLHPQFAQDPQFVTMFLDEARLAGRIRHPNVVATLDVVATENEIFLVMDYVHGESLARVLREVSARQAQVPLPIALRIATDVLQGLHAAHEARDERGAPLNIVHRDISPQNILLGVDGMARLVDFGVAKASGQGQTTRDGHIKGKLGYMAPEQLRGRTVTRQTDVHAFAIVFWEMLTARRMFSGATEADTIAMVVQHEYEPASKSVPGLKPEVDAVVKKGLAESLPERYATARDMCLALEACGEIASTMQVADWVQGQVHELLETRTQVVSSIESGAGDSRTPPHATGHGVANNTPAPHSAKEWVSRLSSPDLGDGTETKVANTPATGRPGTEATFGTGLSAHDDEPSGKRSSGARARGLGLGRVGSIVAAVLVLGCVVIASFTLGGRNAQHDSAAQTPVAANANVSASSAANAALAAVQGTGPVPSSATAPVAVASSTAVAPTPTPSTSASPPSASPPPTTARKATTVKAAPRAASNAAAHDDVFNSRE